ncbi:hypothetical protein F8388_016844 [Cannabis sativa]|uniref:Uncharacterized protein n=1 Tax=Cannabis sativa TaxID=3483 RepID=A0A7J6ERR2_CANSA|nr:hypothetical protein F8388_016844 [Cannabis sativa]
MSSGGNKVVCVSGATGFIASWLVKLLLQHGYTVKASIRNPMKGTLNILKSCVKFGCVKRVVLTSSMAAVMYNGKSLNNPNVVVDESWFSDPLYCEELKSWYALSKILAEKAAWEFAKENKIDLVTLLPTFVIGPALSPTLSQTFPNRVYSYVDVRDVALAHLQAFEVASANGRYCLVGHTLHISKVVWTLEDLSLNSHSMDVPARNQNCNNIGAGEQKTLHNHIHIGGDDQLNVTCSEYERNALLDFKTGLEDPLNRLTSWNNGSNNCCQWYGIGCNKAGEVIAVDFRNRWDFGGEIRPSLIKLKSLRYLDLSFIAFNNIPIPGFFGSLENLRYLNLSNGGFGGSFPVNTGNLSRLQYLDLDSNTGDVDNLEWITSLGLVSLKHLVINGINLSMMGLDLFGIILNKLPSLTELHMSSCRLKGPFPSVSFVNSTTSLAVLDLSDNNFNSKIPNWLANISSLVSLDLSYGGLHGRIPLGFAELPNLQTLHLHSNTNLSASCSQFFRGRWKSIKVVDLSDNMLHGKLPTSIGNMTSLTYLDLSENNVQGGIPGSIGKLCNLNWLDMSYNKLNGTLPELLEGTHSCHSQSPLPSLNYLYLDNNELVGILPQWLGQLRNLVELSLGNNMLHGPIPKSLESWQNLSYLDLVKNRLNGTLPDSLGQLSELFFLDISFNQLTGNITETHFLKLDKLNCLRLSSNSFTLTVSSNWTPPFHVVTELLMRSCHLGPSFPTWLRSQNNVISLDLSNASISSSVPDWFWENFSNLSSLNVSFNQLKGQLPKTFNIAQHADVDLSSNQFEGPIPLPEPTIQLLDLSNNKFSGPIPKNIGDFLENMLFFSLSTNQIDGSIPDSIGNMYSLTVLDLSSNSLIGKIPLSFGKFSQLHALDLSKNHLSGTIPNSLGQLIYLKTLHLGDNKFSGSIPSSLKYLSRLETLDLGNNRLVGEIPHFLCSLKQLRIIKLRSNAFFGELPSLLSNLSSLQVLDLADNVLNGSIPGSYGCFKGMIQVQRENFIRSYGGVLGEYEESVVLNLNGRELTYTKILSLVVNLDLSDNNLSGELPSNLTNLLGLVNLNLSNNHISGSIPEDISKLGQLLSLDLSSNRLSSTIPNSLSSLSFLGHLNLSNNDFSGKIPYNGHMTTFEASSFAGNKGLCGKPLVVKCPGDNGTDFDKKPTPKDHIHDDDNFIDRWFYLSVGLGFAAGLLVPFFMMAMKKSWSETYFSFVEIVVEGIPFFERRMRARRQWPRGLHH